MREALELTRHLASLDQGVGEDGETPLGDLLASERPDPEEEVVNALGDARVREVVGRLPEDERDVITLRFGLLGDEPASTREAGARLGLTTEPRGGSRSRRSAGSPRAASCGSCARPRSAGSRPTTA